MEKITGNEPAMPVEMDYDEGGAKSHRVSNSTWKETGLTIRQHFAAMAMQGLLANHLMVDTLTKQAQVVIVQEAVYYADALISELNKQTIS